MKELKEHYETLLNLQTSNWTITDVELDMLNEAIVVKLDFLDHTGFCAKCNGPATIYDYRPARRWRHLDLLQYKCYLEARPIRMNCKSCGILTANLPWASPDQRQTHRYENHVIDVLRYARNTQAACSILEVDWHTAQRIQKDAVTKGLAGRTNRRINYLGVDEKQFRKGHQYITVLTDLDGGHVLDVADGRTADACEGLITRSLSYFQAKSVKAVAMDMWPAYRRAIGFMLGDADIVYDRFHVAGYLGKAVDQVRKTEHRELMKKGDELLKGSKWIWLGNKRSVRRNELLKTSLKVGRAWSIKEAARKLYEYQSLSWANKYFDWWYGWAIRSQLRPMKEAGKFMKRHREGIMNYFKHRITNSKSESMNAVIQRLKSNASGFRNFENLRTSILFYCGGLTLKRKMGHSF